MTNLFVISEDVWHKFALELEDSIIFADKYMIEMIHFNIGVTFLSQQLKVLNVFPIEPYLLKHIYDDTANTTNNNNIHTFNLNPWSYKNRKAVFLLSTSLEKEEEEEEIYNTTTTTNTTVTTTTTQQKQEQCNNSVLHNICRIIKHFSISSLLICCLNTELYHINKYQHSFSYYHDYILSSLQSMQQKQQQQEEEEQQPVIQVAIKHFAASYSLLFPQIFPDSFIISYPCPLLSGLEIKSINQSNQLLEQHYDNNISDTTPNPNPSSFIIDKLSDLIYSFTLLIQSQTSSSSSSIIDPLLFSVGSLSQSIALKIGAMYKQRHQKQIEMNQKQNKRKQQENISIILIDRSLDLLAPCQNGNNLLDWMYDLLPRSFAGSLELHAPLPLSISPLLDPIHLTNDTNIQLNLNPNPNEQTWKTNIFHRFCSTIGHGGYSEVEREGSILLQQLMASQNANEALKILINTLDIICTKEKCNIYIRNNQSNHNITLHELGNYLSAICRGSGGEGKQTVQHSDASALTNPSVPLFRHAELMHTIFAATYAYQLHSISSFEILQTIEKNLLEIVSDPTNEDAGHDTIHMIIDFIYTYLIPSSSSISSNLNTNNNNNSKQKKKHGESLKHGDCNLKDIFKLVIYTFSLLGSRWIASSDELELRIALVDCIQRFPNEWEKIIFPYTNINNNNDIILFIQDFISKLKLLSHGRQYLGQFGELFTGDDVISGDGACYDPLVVHLLKHILDKSYSSSLDDDNENDSIIFHQTIIPTASDTKANNGSIGNNISSSSSIDSGGGGGVGSLFKKTLGRFQRNSSITSVTHAKPDDSSLIVFFIVGGITCEELQKLNSIVARQSRHQVLIGATKIVSASDIISDIFIPSTSSFKNNSTNR